MSAEVKSMKEWALYYAELGLAVFPLAYRNKVPAIEGGCKAATTEKSKIERWWNQNPRYNIGIATGNKSNGLVVIDLDVDKNKGIDGYAYKSTAEKCNVESQKLEHINGRLYSSYNKLKNKVEEYRQKNSRLVQVMQNLQKAAARVGMVVKNMGSALRRAGSAIKSMVSAMKKAVENMFNLNKQTDRSRMSLSRMLGMSLLFSGVSRAISAVSDGVKSGFENLAQYSNSIGSNGAKAIASSTVSSAIDNVLKRLRQQDIEIERFTHHAFRNTFATRYIEEGGNMQTLQKILGHSSLAMTADLYAHVLPNTKQQEMQQIENGFIGVAVL